MSDEPTATQTGPAMAQAHDSLSPTAQPPPGRQPQAPRPQGLYPPSVYPPGPHLPGPYPPGPHLPGPYPPGPHPPGPYPPGRAPVRARRGPGLPPPVAYQPIPQTPFGVAVVGVAPTVSGPATASLVVGVGSILVALVVGCFGALGAEPGWGPMVSGAFAVLAGFAGVAAIVLGRVGRRQVRADVGWRAVTGRGMALAGVICGFSGLVLTVLAFAGAFLLAAQT